MLFWLGLLQAKICTEDVCVNLLKENMVQENSLPVVSFIGTEKELMVSVLKDPEIEHIALGTDIKEMDIMKAKTDKAEHEKERVHKSQELSSYGQQKSTLFPVIHYSPQEMSEEVLQARKNLMKTIQTFLRKFNRYPFGEMPKVLLVAWEKFSEIKHTFTDKQYQPEDIQELMRKLLQDLQNISEELAEYINSPSWNRPAFYFNDDDDEYTIIYRKPKAITPDLPTEEPDNSLSMGDEHLNTISEMEKSSVENLVPIPSEFKGISEDICDVPSCDNDHFDAECGLINSLLSRDISITSPKIDFLPEEFAGELDLIDPILPGIDEKDFDEDDFDEEEGEI
ncbi:hypothetical protein Tco_0488414 [Tanacetum coccineum]